MGITNATLMMPMMHYLKLFDYGKYKKKFLETTFTVTVTDFVV